MKIFLLILICTIRFISVFAQNTNKVDIQTGNDYFNAHNFLMALPVYTELLKENNEDAELQFKIAQCYLRTNSNKSNAISHLEFCIKSPKCPSEAWLKLGEAYRLSNKIEEAINAFEKYAQLEPKKQKITEREIELCKNAKALMQHPINISFTNLGKEINSEFPDYYPCITSDESLLAFTTRRKGATATQLEIDGYYASDIYTSKLEKGKRARAENIGANINTSLDEQVVGLQADGSHILIYADHIDKYGDIYVSEKKTGGFSKCTPFPLNINNKVEHSASLSADGNTLFLVKGETKDGQTDIFICKKLPNGEWGEPYKLGDEINTPYNEDFPYLAKDGVTLYFSSQGHNTMGGFDLFKSIWNPEKNTWTQAENLGYPLNTTDDDRSISLTEDGRVAYISAVRPGGIGDLDIYRVTFNDVNQKIALYLGNVVLGDSLSQLNNNKAVVLATSSTGKGKLKFITNPNNGKLFMALPAGTYDISIKAEGFSELKDRLIVSDFGVAISEEKKNYKLQKL